MTRSGNRSHELLLKGPAWNFPSFHLDQPITTLGDECSPSDRNSRLQLPTPLANDAEKRGAVNANDPRNGLVGRVKLWQTPRTDGFDAGKHRGRADSLHSQVKTLWPTPDASVVNDGETLASWRARKERNLEKHNNGNGMGTPLTIAAVQHSGATRRLNPLFVEWLMGLPEGWTSLAHLDCER